MHGIEYKPETQNNWTCFCTGKINDIKYIWLRWKTQYSSYELFILEGKEKRYLW
jgi:hypothetical protein